MVFLIAGATAGTKEGIIFHWIAMSPVSIFASMVSVTISTSRLVIADQTTVEAYLPSDLYSAKVVPANNDKDWSVTIETSRGPLNIRMGDILSHEADWPNTRAGAIRFLQDITPLIQQVPSSGTTPGVLADALVDPLTPTTDVVIDFLT